MFGHIFGVTCAHFGFGFNRKRFYTPTGVAQRTKAIGIYGLGRLTQQRRERGREKSNKANAKKCLSHIVKSSPLNLMV
jgi:hypothetical protein